MQNERPLSRGRYAAFCRMIVRRITLFALMAFPRPQFSKNQINRAGEIITSPENFTTSDQEWATEVLSNYRACHGYPINTFQATLRGKLQTIDPNAIVAQRLKRTPSIVLKLQRFQGMQLARMQDIGGLRAYPNTEHAATFTRSAD